MTQFLVDPTDPSQAFIASSTDMHGFNAGDVRLTNIHSPLACEGRPCVVHHPSEHHMVSWPLHWRDDRGMAERICPHDVGHPDPDEATFRLEQRQLWALQHGCDGCCNPQRA